MFQLSLIMCVKVTSWMWKQNNYWFHLCDSQIISYFMTLKENNFPHNFLCVSHIFSIFSRAWKSNNLNDFLCKRQHKLSDFSYVKSNKWCHRCESQHNLSDSLCVCVIVKCELFAVCTICSWIFVSCTLALLEVCFSFLLVDHWWTCVLNVE